MKPHCHSSNAKGAVQMGAQEIMVSTKEGTVELRLPKLLVNLFQGDSLVRTVEIDDPRELLINIFNRDNRELGLVAEPA